MTVLLPTVSRFHQYCCLSLPIALPPQLRVGYRHQSIGHYGSIHFLSLHVLKATKTGSVCPLPFPVFACFFFIRATLIVFIYYVFFSYFISLVALVLLSKPVQAIYWRDWSPSYRMLMGMLIPTHCLLN